VLAGTVVAACLQGRSSPRACLSEERSSPRAGSLAFADARIVACFSGTATVGASVRAGVERDTTDARLLHGHERRARAYAVNAGARERDRHLFP